MISGFLAEKRMPKQDRAKALEMGLAGRKSERGISVEEPYQIHFVEFQEYLHLFESSIHVSIVCVRKQLIHRKIIVY